MTSFYESSVDRLFHQEIDMKVGAAELAIGDALESNVLLELDDLRNRLVFNGAQLLVGYLAPRSLGTCLQQILGTQETADVVVTGRQRGMIGH